MDIKPVILLTAGFDGTGDTYTVNQKYCRIIEKCGALPLIIPYTNAENMNLLLKKASAVILTGGGDISPHISGAEHAVFSKNCNEKRDAFEIRLCRYCYSNGIHLMGICRGMQVMCIAAGGSIYEDISVFSSDAQNHMQCIDKKLPSHKVYINHKSILYNILKKDSIYVNSLHHQCVKDSGFLKLSAVSKDGVAEAVEGHTNALFMGFQWHPEQCLYGGHSEKIFNFFIDNCR